MNVLVTGAAGFFGHHLIAHIHRETDWNVVALVRLSKVGSLRRLSEVADMNRTRIVFHDLRSPINPFIAAEIGAVDYILHVGAETHVDRSIRDPAPFVESNIIGTMNLLNFALRIGNLRCFAYFSTDEVYGPQTEGKYSVEGDPYDCRNPYSASKAGAEQLVTAYDNTYRIPTLITNTMNLFGERQHPEKFIPLVIRKVLDSAQVTIHADPTRTRAGSRHYIYADDAADGFLFCLSQGGRFNIVGAREVDNLTLATKIAEILDKPLEYELVDFHSARPGHDLRYAMSGEKLERLGWTPPTDFDAALEKTVRWTVDHPEWLCA